MPFIIESILSQNQALATVNENHSIQDAISIMIERDFSQLVVVDHHGKLRGLVTSDSILKALSFCETTVSQLKVSHALIKIKAYRIDEDLSELLKGLRDINAVPIVDKQGFPKAIVTSFDTTEYFRTRAEDIMLAEDVETTLRDFIESFYKNSDGDVDEGKLKEAIEAITSSGQDAEKKFHKALRKYLGQSGLEQSTFDKERASQIFTNYLAQPTKARAFGELTLYEYVQLFRNVWDHYQSSFKGMEWTAVDKLLAAVRNTRNAIAHFREITPQQREQLKYCADFLDRHRPSVSTIKIESGRATAVGLPINIAVSDKVTSLVQQIPSLWQSTISANQANGAAPSVLEPPTEEIDPSDSRYAPLAVWLQRQEQDKIPLSFEDVEAIIQDTLPASARRHRNWWANDSVGHTQSQQWLEAGWRVSNINLSEEKVVFSRISERKIAYANFFSALQPKVEAISDLSVNLTTNPQGGHWVTFEASLEGYPKATYHLSFARGSKLRLEHYIDVGDRDVNKRIFDHLQAQRADIEAEFGAPLSWERLVGLRSTRVAVYRENSSITDSPEALEEMQNWVVQTLPRFYNALAKRFQVAVEATKDSPDVADL
jgi:CBS domain-containing protein